MLLLLLDELEKSNGDLSLNDLERKLGIEASALDGMIQFLVQTGRLIDTTKSETKGSSNACATCSSECGYQVNYSISSMKLRINK